MWVVTTDDRTVNIEGATEITVQTNYYAESFIDPADSARDALDSDEIQNFEVCAELASGERIVLAKEACEPSDTPAKVQDCARKYVAKIRHALASGFGLCDLKSVD